MKNVNVQKRGRSRMLRAIVSTGLALLFATVSYAQIRVTGKVVDASGNPIPGTAISVPGTNTGTTVDAQGNYSLSVPSSASELEFSFLGYETVLMTVGDRTVIDVVLSESSIGIESVVAIGYGTRKSTDLTGSVGSITNDAIVARGSSSVMGALQGAIPGVNITQSSAVAGGGFKIQIRGQQTMSTSTGATNPLFVVDGIVVPDIDFLNPGDIERIDVLKDASSAAIYGSRGANGVVLVTTNQAANVRDRFSISYDGYYGIHETVRTGDFMDGDDFMAYRMYAMLQHPTDTGGDGVNYFENATQIGNAMAHSPLMVKRWGQKNFFDVIGSAFPTTHQQNHSLSANGSSGNTSYQLGMGYTKEDGNYPGNAFERVNLRGGFQSKANDWITFGFNTTMSMINNDRGAHEAVRDIIRLNPYTPPYDSKGNLIPTPMNAASEWIATAEEPLKTGSAFSSQTNPLIDAENVIYNTRAFNVLANLFTEIEPIEGLKIKTQFSPMLRTSRIGQFYGIESNSGISNGTNSAIVRRSMDFEYTWDNSVSYAWMSENGDHNLDATGVYSVYFNRGENSQMEGRNLSNNSFHAIGTASERYSSSSGYTQGTMLSVIGRLNYSYKGKYLATVSYRTDGSSRLGDGHKWDSFPSAALAWRISEEPFLQNWEALTNAKLRVSYGLTGNNRGVGAYSTMTGLDAARYYGFGTTQVSGQPTGSVGNKTLRWERSKEFNVGLDLGFFRNRLSATIDWYDRVSEDLLMGMAVPVELGMKGNSISANVGSVRNRGIEVGVTGVILANNNWNWTLGATFARNRNKILELYGAKEDRVGERHFIGQPINVAYTYVFDGIVTAERAANDKLAKDNNIREGYAISKDLNNDGKFDLDNDRKITGSAFSDWTGSLTSTLSWKNLDFSFNIYADMGRYDVNQLLRSNAAALNDRGRMKLKLDYYVPASWIRAELSGMTGGDWYTPIAQQYGLPAHPYDVLKPNTDGVYPSYNRNNEHWGGNTGGDNSQSTFQDLSYVKVKNITLGYTLPKAWVSAIGLTKVRLYVNVLNPWVFTHKDFIGFDPEWANTALDGFSRGDIGGVARRTWQFGLNVKF